MGPYSTLNINILSIFGLLELNYKQNIVFSIPIENFKTSIEVDVVKKGMCVSIHGLFLQ